MSLFSERKLKKMTTYDMLKLTLGKIAFAKNNQLASIVFDEEIDKNKLLSCDMSAVSELKKNKDGTIDIKLYDKLKAADLLLNLFKFESENDFEREDFLTDFIKTADSLNLNSDKGENSNNEDINKLDRNEQCEEA